MNYNFYMKPFIKICGITNQKDLDFICSEDIDAIGFNLYLNSKRYVQLSDVKNAGRYESKHPHIFDIC